MPFETVPILQGRHFDYRTYFIVLGVFGQGFWAIMCAVFGAWLRWRTKQTISISRDLTQTSTGVALVDCSPVIHEFDRSGSDLSMTPRSTLWYACCQKCLALLVYVMFAVAGVLLPILCMAVGLGDYTFGIPSVFALIVLVPSALVIYCAPKAFQRASSIFLAFAVFNLGGIFAQFAWFSYLNIFIAWILVEICLLSGFRIAKRDDIVGVRWWGVTTMYSLVLAGLVTLALYDMCLSVYTSDSQGTLFTVMDSAYVSTRWSRPHFSCLHSSGDNLMPCHVYLTLAENASSSVFVNMHIPLQPHAVHVRVYALCENQGGCASPERKASAAHVDHAYLGEGDREVHSAIIRDLSAAADYKLVIEVAGRNLTSLPHWRFRTAPPEDEDLKLVFGGDMGSSLAVSQLMALGVGPESNDPPAAVVIGGDIAYDNGMATCWCVWEDWLDRWDAAMVRAKRLVPLVLAVGNHDVGTEAAENVKPPKVDRKVLPFFTFFPQHSDNLPDVPHPDDRRPYHSHRIGRALVLVLDSGYVAQSHNTGDQFIWAESVINETDAASRAIFPTYHVPIYAATVATHSEWGTGPSSPFVSLFDAHDVRIAFENHVHAFKRTVPMRNHKFDEKGTVYLGDGMAGIHGLGVPDSADLLPRSQESRLAVDSLSREHFWHVQLTKDTNVVKSVDSDGVQFDSFQQTF